MSTAARKARKRAGIKFFKEPKVGTPLAQRSVGIHYQPTKGGFMESNRALRKIGAAAELLGLYQPVAGSAPRRGNRKGA